MNYIYITNIIVTCNHYSRVNCNNNRVMVTLTGCVVAKDDGDVLNEDDAG